MQLPSKTDVLRIVIAALVTGLIIAALIPVMLEDMRRRPSGSFIVARKEVKQRNPIFFLPWWETSCYFFYTYQDYPVEVMEQDFNEYQAGDLYPNNYTVCH